jgi:tetratricopeptide (TPR) repeat protein
LILGAAAGYFVVTVHRYAPEPASAHYARCTRLAQRAPDEALREAKAWESANPDTPMPRHCEALALYAKRDYVGAASLLSKLAGEARAGHPHLSQELTLQAVLGWQAAGKPEDARAELNRALALRPELWPNADKIALLLARARLSQAYGHPFDAVQDTDHALALDAGSKEALDLRAQLDHALVPARH